jgi:hypothetical protein
MIGDLRIGTSAPTMVRYPSGPRAGTTKVKHTSIHTAMSTRGGADEHARGDDSQQEQDGETGLVVLTNGSLKSDG